ncbi:MAG: amidohydrolase [Isosphaeraceae bacterium]|nr:amidohydrolase [Isosphaeraceae bacterium]
MRLRIAGVAALWVAGAFSGACLGASDDWFAREGDRLLALYTHLHSHPELSLHEVETSARIARELRDAGARVTERVGKLGVVGVIENGKGPTVLVRADMDALPVVEETGAPFASKVTTVDDDGKTVGVMHACGHDIHMTCLVGVARRLIETRAQWSGTVVLIAQPAEEKVGGAEMMLADGLYERFPKPDYALALHVSHDLETGKLAYTSGPAMASSTSVDVVVRGKGGHGAMPHATVDPIVLASLLVLDLQSIVSREINPIHPAVVTVGSIHGGSKHNIIGSEVHLQLTLRAYREDVRKSLIEGIERRAKALATGHRAPDPTVTVSDGTPATINDPALVAKVLPFLEKAVGKENVRTVDPTMGAEDFGLFCRGGVPIFMFRLGTIPPERVAKAKAEGSPLPSLHSPIYLPDARPSIRTGVEAMTSAVIGLLPKN